MGTYISDVSDPKDSADIDCGYGTAAVTRLTGLSYRRLDYLARKGFLRPSVADGSGSGTRRLYSFEDLVALRTIAKLRAAGVSLGALKSVIAFLRSRGLGQPLVGTQLVVDGEDVLLVETDEEAVSLLRRPSQQALRFVVDVGVVVNELRAGDPAGTSWPEATAASA